MGGAPGGASDQHGGHEPPPHAPHVTPLDGSKKVHTFASPTQGPEKMQISGQLNNVRQNFHEE